jgi:MarR family transcriptional regulator, negative regulator of the multidrug operon emrRAB
MSDRIEPIVVRDQVVVTETFWRLARIEGLRQAGLTKAIRSYSILDALLRVPGNRSSLTNLAKDLDLSRSNVTRMLDFLERRGLVERVGKGHDRRVTVIKLTAAGQGIAERVQPIEAQIAKEITAGFSDAELAQFIQYLVRLQNAARSLLPATLSRKRS